MKPLVRSAFNQGQVPTISCVDGKSSLEKYVDLSELVVALQSYVDDYFANIWGTPCLLVLTKGKIPKSNWAIVFLDKSDDPTADGYHDLTKHGLPLSKVFIETAIDANGDVDADQITITASHELAEMLVDPGLQMGAQRPRVGFYAYETADPVEESSFTVNGFAMSNFVYPAWFESFRKARSTQFDQMKQCHQPFQLLEGGYASIYRGDKWRDKFGSPAKSRAFKKRSHLRRKCRATPGPLKRSTKD